MSCSQMYCGHHPELVGCGCSNISGTALEVGCKIVEIHCGPNVGSVGIHGQHQHVCIGPVILDYHGGCWMWLISL